MPNLFMLLVGCVIGYVLGGYIDTAIDEGKEL